MIIQNFSNDSKRGFAVGSNSLTPEKIAAGAVTLASALMISAIGGLFSRKKPAKTRAGSTAKSSKKKKALPLLAMPLVFKAAKKAAQQGVLNNIAVKYSPPEVQDDSGIELENAIPIASEDEIYEHI